MNDASRREPRESISETLDQELERICVAFQRAWQDGEQPRLMEAIADWPHEAGRDELFESLLLIEIAARRELGERPKPRDYLEAAPHYQSRIEAVFQIDTLDSEHGMRASTVSVPPLDDTVTETPRLTSGPAGATPQRLGDYEIIEELGRGGMGVVFKATQQSANRTVALKVIRSDRLSSFDDESRQEVVQRFRSEAQAAAKLDHDNMVTVYDVGHTDGEHYYSMRYVSGKSLSQVLQDGPLDGVQAAKYVVGVCRAIQAAHEQKILHRDLKPSNVIVDERTDRALVADFGLAKLMSMEQSATQTGAVMGTPPYMAPEQTRDASKVDERADLYGIGATLYHLLTGRPPFQTPSIAETIRQVNAEEPVAPRRLNPAVHRDLETICLKCLEKDPAARYASAQEIERELNRFLEGEPIEARPIGSVKRLARWAGKNRAIAALSATTLMLAIALFLAAVAGYFTVSDSLARETEARSDAQRQAELAKQNLYDAFEAANNAFTRIAADDRLRGRNLEALRVELLEDVIPFLDKFSRQAPDEPKFQLARAVALRHLSKVKEETGERKAAAENLDQALRILETLPDSPPLPGAEAERAFTLVDRGGLCMAENETDRAIDLMQQSLEILEKLQTQSPSDEAIVLGLAMVHSNLATVIFSQRPARSIEAKTHFDQAIEIRERYRQAHPNNDVNNSHLAQTYSNYGNYLFEKTELGAAEQAYRKGLQILSEHGDTLQHYHNFRPTRLALNYELGLLAQTRRRYDEAERLLKQAVEDGEVITAANPQLPDFAHRWAKSQLALAVVQHALKRADGAITSGLDQATATLQALVKAHDKPEYLSELSRALEVYSVYFQSKGDFKKQYAQTEACLEIRKRLVRDYPDHSEYKYFLAMARFNMGVVCRELNQVVEAETHYLDALRLLRELQAKNEISGRAAVGLTDVLNNLVSIYLETDRSEKAGKLLDELTPLLDAFPKNLPQIQLNVGRLRLQLGQELLSKKKIKPAELYLSAAIKPLAHVLELDPRDQKASVLLSGAYLSRAEIFGQTGRFEEGKKDWESVLKYAPPETALELQVRRAAWTLRYMPKPKTSESKKNASKSEGSSND